MKTAFQPCSYSHHGYLHQLQGPRIGLVTRARTASCVMSILRFVTSIRWFLGGWGGLESHGLVETYHVAPYPAMSWVTNLLGFTTSSEGKPIYNSLGPALGPAMLRRMVTKITRETAVGQSKAQPAASPAFATYFVQVQNKRDLNELPDGSQNDVPN